MLVSEIHADPMDQIITIDQYPAVRKYAGYNPAIDIRAGAHSDYGEYDGLGTLILLL